MRLLLISLLAACAVGCSGEPDSDDFEAFARELPGRKLNITRIHEDGHEVHGTAELLSFDLRKTDSLTAPFKGTATYSYTNGPVPFRHESLASIGYATPCHEYGELVLHFAWIDGDWEYVDGQCIRKGCELLEIDLDDLSHHAQESASLSEQSWDISHARYTEGRAIGLSQFFTDSMDEWKGYALSHLSP